MVAPAAILDTAHTRSIDVDALRRRVNALAPGADSSALRWNEITLFATATLYEPRIAAARAALATSMADAGVARQWSTLSLTLTMEYANDPAAASSWLFGGAVDMPIDRGGRRSARIDTAELAVLTARHGLADALWSARMAIAYALTDRALADRQTMVLGALAAARDRQFAAVERQVAVGLATRGDLERVRADAADARRRLTEAETRTARAVQALASAIGAPYAQIAALPVDWPGLDDFIAVLPDVTPGTLSQGVLSRADVLKAVVAYDQTESDLRGEIAKQYPAMTVAPGYTWDRGLVKLPVSIGLELPALDLNRHAIVAAEARRAEAARQLEAVIFEADAAVAFAVLEGRAARVALAQIRASELPAARELAAQAEHQLAAGKINRADWAAAQAGAESARLSEADAVVRVRLAQLALENALRRPLRGTEVAMRPAATEETSR